MSDKIIAVYFGVSQRAFQGISVHFLMKGENNDSSILMAHLNMATPSADLLRPQPF